MGQSSPARTESVYSWSGGTVRSCRAERYLGGAVVSAGHQVAAQAVRAGQAQVLHRQADQHSPARDH